MLIYITYLSPHNCTYDFLSSTDDKEEDFGGCYSSVYGKSSEGDREMEGIDGDGGGKMPADDFLNKSSEGACFVLLLFVVI